RVKRLEKKGRSRTHGLKRLYKVGLTAKVDSSNNEQSLGDEDESKHGRKIHDIDTDEDITLVNDQDAEMFDVNDDLRGEEVFVSQKVPLKGDEVNAASIATTATVVTIDEITLAQALMEIKTSKPKAKGVTIQEPSETTTTTVSS
nr:hypothetical protein [Tanacetum cinerariifolium]